MTSEEATSQVVRKDVSSQCEINSGGISGDESSGQCSASSRHDVAVAPSVDE